MPIKNAGILGAGTMGNGIAHVFARAGYSVTLCDVEQRFIDRAMETIGKNLDREAAKGRISAEDRVATLERIAATTDRIGHVHPPLAKPSGEPDATTA